MKPAASELTFAGAVARAEAHARGARRMLLGITGPPGAGKSTLAGAIASRLGHRVCVVGMDGYHLAQRELLRLGRAERKGAPDTFDAAGYVAMLRRLRDPEEEHIYAPEFRRELEEPIAGAIAIAPHAPLVVTEGNYLLLEDSPWSVIRDLLDEVWFVVSPEETRVRRLIARHVAFGRSPEAARDWVLGTDQRNAELISSTRCRADLLVRIG